MTVFMRALILATCCVGMSSPNTGFAQDVTLKSSDNSISISGNFLGFDGEFYRVDSEFGTLTVDSSGVECEGPGCPELEGYYPTVRFSGDSVVVSTLLPALVTAFAQRHGYAVDITDFEPGQKLELLDSVSGDPAASFELYTTSSAEGFADLVTENTDVVVSLREASLAEKSLAKEASIADLDDPIRARVLGLDAVVPIVSPRNPLKSISLEELEGVFSGRFRNWSELGGADAPIAVYAGPDILSEGAIARTLTFKAHQDISPQAVKFETNAEAVEAVLSDPYGIAFGRLSQQSKTKALDLTGACGFRAGARSADVKTEDYPMTQPMFLYTPARRLPKIARDFLGFILSPAAQIIVARSAFVDQAVDEYTFRDHGRRFANAIAHAGGEVALEDLQDITAALYGRRRLSLGFRFEGGSARLDAQSRSNVQLLSQLIEAGVYDGKELIFAGFSDGEGAASLNSELSRKRAQAVQLSIVNALGTAFAADKVQLAVRGFGEAMPLACDDVDWGRSLNRRVEIWVRD